MPYFSKNFIKNVSTYLQTNKLGYLRAQLNELIPSQIVELFNNLSDEEQVLVFNELNPKLMVDTFPFLPLDLQKHIIAEIKSDKAALILNQMSPDDRTSFLEELSSSTVADLIKLMSPRERLLTLQLLGYPEDSVGRLMTPDYVAVKKNWTVQQVLSYIRKRVREDTEFLDTIYVVDEDHFLIAELNLKDCLIAPANQKIAPLLNTNLTTLHVQDPAENAIEVFRKNGRIALPVVDEQNVLLGIVTLDDILEIVQEEFSEDIQKIGAVQAFEEAYIEVPFFELIQKRVGWLIILFFGELLTATALGFFEEEIAKAVVLSLFIPLIISSGGNSGSQASTLVIRSLALNELTMKDWFRVFKREIGSGLVLGSILGIIGLLRVIGWEWFFGTYGDHWLAISMTICISLIGVVLWGTLTGSMLPFILKRLGFDPATSSGPFVATLVDVTGIVIYFSVAYFFLRNTLLA